MGAVTLKLVPLALALVSLGFTTPSAAQSGPATSQERGGLFDFLFRSKPASPPAPPPQEIYEKAAPLSDLIAPQTNVVPQPDADSKAKAELPAVGPSAPRRPSALGAPKPTTTMRASAGRVPSPAQDVPPASAAPSPKSRPHPTRDAKAPLAHDKAPDTVVMLVRPDLQDATDFHGRRVALGMPEIDRGLGARLRSDWGAIVVDPAQPNSSRIQALSKALVDDEIDGVALALETSGMQPTTLPPGPYSVLRLPVK